MLRYEGDNKYKKWEFELGFQDQNFLYPKHSKMEQEQK